MSKILNLSIAVLSLAGTVAYADFIEGPVKWSQPITVGGIPVDPQQPVPAGSFIDGIGWFFDHTETMIRADDFTSDGRPIVAVRWWGSYTADQTVRPDGFTGPFDISFHLSDGEAHPDSKPLPAPPLELYTNITAQEVFVGGINGVTEPVYRYDAYLPIPFFEQAGVEYFLDIDKPSSELWAWHYTTIQKQDYSVVASSHSGPWTSTGGFDLAFELIAVPEPATLGLAILGGLMLLGRRR